MPLILNLRHIERETLQLEGEIGTSELEIDGIDELVRPTGPVGYRLEVERQEQGVFVHGRLWLPLICECARCLRSFEWPLVLDPWAVLVPLEGEEAAPVVGDCVDLTPYVREDIVLGFPQRPLCETECGGLPAGSPGRSSESGKAPQGEGVSTAWAELNRLKF
jgi:uncharacterized protein